MRYRHSTGGGGSAFTPAADSGSGSEVSTALTISGTASEVETSVSGTTVTVGLPASVAITTGLTVGGSTVAAVDDENTILASQIFG